MIRGYPRITAEQALELLRDGHYIRHMQHIVYETPTKVTDLLYFANPEFRIHDGGDMYLIYEFLALAKELAA